MGDIEEARAQSLPGLIHDTRLKVKHAQQILRKTDNREIFFHVCSSETEGKTKTNNR